MAKKAILSYRNSLHCYHSAMRICQELYDDHCISIEVYKEIEKRLAEKYDLKEDSLFHKTIS